MRIYETHYIPNELEYKKLVLLGFYGVIIVIIHCFLIDVSRSMSVHHALRQSTPVGSKDTRGVHDGIEDCTAHEKGLHAFRPTTHWPLWSR